MNNEKILAHVRMFVLREKLLCPGEPLHLAAAVSGGADSMALLRILLALQPEFGFVLSACHVNHGLRGESADRDEAFVRAECARLGVPLRVFHAAEMADEVGLPSEHAGGGLGAPPALCLLCAFVRGGDRCRCNGPYCK